jgi:hypothetical protein
MKLTLLALVCALVSVISHAEEGMWLFNHLPVDQLKSSYGFEPTQAWTDHVMRSSVRFNSGGSGSFVSSTGLVLTNHHVAADTLQKISNATTDYYRVGFYAKTPAEEIASPDLELDQLISIQDVTARVQGAVAPGMSPADAFAARASEMAAIEKESFAQTGLRSDVVTLYQGGQFHLYRYKRYTDVRLVFAPEFDMAFFGGDPDNFEYPRYDLDMALFRVYENGKPVAPADYLSWSAKGAAEGDLIFVSGNPGSTSRELTVSALEALRDFTLPFKLDMLFRTEIFLQQFAFNGADEARWSEEDYFGAQNSRKVYMGQLAALENPAVMAAKQASEARLRAAVGEKPELAPTLAAWDRVSAAQGDLKRVYKQYTLLEQARGFNSSLFTVARTLVRLAAESAKPNDQRLPEFRDSARDALEQQLYSPAPVEGEYEKAKLASSLQLLEELLGADDPTVVLALGGKSPEDRAAELVDGSALASVAVRRQLAAGGVGASSDAMIRFAALVDPASRAVRKDYEDTVTGPQQSAYADIARDQFAAFGDTLYPDATFTLRLAFGTVKGYSQDGKWVNPVTTIAGAFQHETDHGGVAPYVLPSTWHQAHDQLDLTTPLNFAASADIIGGNSGSPVLNRAGELVGLIFDGNIQSTAGAYFYDGAVNRAVAVESPAMLEAIRKVYAAPALADELTGKPALH